MNKGIGFITKILTSKRLSNILLYIAVILLVLMIIALCFIKTDNVMAKMIGIGYLVATEIFILLVSIPRTTTEMGFRKTTIWSFVIWTICLAAIGGTIIGCLVSWIFDLEVIQTCILTISIITVVLAIFWFGQKLLSKECNTIRLDMYSSIMVGVLTLLSLSVEYSSMKEPFLAIFFIYLVLQILIKWKTCIIEEK